MSVFFFTDARFYRTPNGAIYSGEYSFSDVLWTRYQKAFGDVFIIARMFEVDNFSNKIHNVQNATVLPIPPFESPITFLKNKKKIKGLMMEYYKHYQPQAVIVRGAGSIGYVAAKLCQKHKIKYGIEVIGDPYDVYAPGVIKHPLRPLFRKLFTDHQKNAVKWASSVIYVTQHALQKRYPATQSAFQTYASDVVINACVSQAKTLNSSSTFKIISVGALDQMYKGPDVLIKALKLLKEENKKVHAIWLGNGIHLLSMKELAKELNVEDCIDFKGSVDAQTLVDYLDQSDCFVMASRTEGLPRAIVEAMSRALPCIGSNVGGIPELIHPQLIFESENSDILAQKIDSLSNNAKDYSVYSAYSLNKAKEFDPKLLEIRREQFFKSVK